MPSAGTGLGTGVESLCPTAARVGSAEDRGEPEMPLTPFQPSGAGSGQAQLWACKEPSLFSSSEGSLIIQLVLPGHPLALAAPHMALRELCLHADTLISRGGSSRSPSPALCCGQRTES